MVCHSNFIVVQLPLFYFLFPIGIMGHVGTVFRAKSASGRSPNESTDLGYGMFNLDWQTYVPNEGDDPSYNPYIGANAILNIPSFFKHLRENVNTISGNGLEVSTKRNTGYRKKREFGYSELQAEAGNAVVNLLTKNQASPNSLRRHCRNLGIWNRSLFCTM